MTILEYLIAKGLIEAVEAGENVATQWINDAARHLEAAKSIAELDPSGAYALA